MQEGKKSSFVGKLLKKINGKYKDKVITDERIKHIKKHHPGYSIYIPKIINNLDYIIEDNKNLDTVLYNYKRKWKNIQIVVRLNTNEKEREKQNSILTL